MRDDRTVPQSHDGYPVVVEAVTKRYGGHAVVRDLSFVAEPGRVTGFLGPNGSGKSTAMKIMLGLAAADEGRVLIGDRRYVDLARPPAVVGALLESNAFHPGRSGRNHLRIVAEAQRVDRARVDEVLEMVGLRAAAHRRVGTYSLGMRQRLGFAGALLSDPPVLILDEPANGLDPLGIHEMRDLLRARAARGHTILVSSHLLAEMELLADDVVVIAEGRLVAGGPLEELQESATWVRTTATDRLIAVLSTGGASVTPTETGLIVRGVPMSEIGELACAAGIALHELRAHAGSLEERFLQWTGHPVEDPRPRASS